MMDFQQDQEVMEAFVDETRDRLVELETGILHLEHLDGASVEEVVNEIFRAAHSVKAGAGLLKLHSMERLSHWLENILGRIRTGEIRPDADLVTALLDGIDVLRDLAENVPDCADVDVSEHMISLRDALELARARRRKV
ncbi:two-component system chemotaxis sensor kinase CheA [Desulfobaculum xiamenense]|uniref:Two-component system chemotaxis sensor kinase CheA n=1 Tax=Desulfobaculum xiamenense TaxID=995050 RepID=A0A846QJ66_9BACT|nr:Hpt domain-containing protein [Desulfobaculum xiamenense]NJB68916.1 two-component system chemotaxis sensor kinase CheA [Desulfobaculum xiamenense]